MGFLDGIMKNKSIQDLAFAQLKKFFSEDGAKAIIVTSDPATGEINVDVAKHSLCVYEWSAERKGFDASNPKFYGANGSVPEDIAHPLKVEDGKNSD